MSHQVVVAFHKVPESETRRIQHRQRDPRFPCEPLGWAFAWALGDLVPLQHLDSISSTPNFCSFFAVLVASVVCIGGNSLFILVRPRLCMALATSCTGVLCPSC